MTTTADGWAVELSYTVGTQVFLTATASRSLTGTGKHLIIWDKTSGSRITYCTTGTICSAAGISPSNSPTTYVATIGSDSAYYPPATLDATSNTVTPPAWTVELKSEIVSARVKLTATSNYELSGKFLTLWNKTSGSQVASCATGTTCSAAVSPSHSKTSYIATIGSDSAYYPPPNLMATSNTVTPPAWKIELSRVGSVLTAETNYHVSGSERYISFYNQTTGARIGSCTGGTLCSISLSSNQSHTYVATVGAESSYFAPNPLLAVSNPIGLQGPTGAYETAGGSNPAGLNQCQRCVGDPINTSTGEFFTKVVDLQVAGRGPGLNQTRTYSSQHALQDGPLGYGWASTYSMKAVQDAAGAVQIHHENGSRVSFTPTGGGSYTAPSHVLAKLVLNADGTWTYTRKNREIFTFTPSGQLSKVSDLNGHTVTVAYNAAGNVLSATDATGRAITFTYGANSKIAAATDPAGRTTTYSYDQDGRLASVTTPGGAVTKFAYDAGNLLTSIIDPRGNETVNAYDLARRVTTQTTAAGNLTLSYGMDGSDPQTTITSPGGRVTKETYSAGQLIRKIVGAGTPQAATWAYAYDQTTFGRTSVTDPLGRVSSATYDAQGNKLTSTDTAGNQTSATYGPHNNILTATDAAGTTTTHTYDAAGNLLKSSRPLTGTTKTAVITYAYDPLRPGDLTSLTDPNGNTTTFGYDSHGNQSSTTDGMGRTSQTARDVLGRTTSTSTPSGKITAFAHNADGYLVSTTDPLGKAATFAYDPAGNKTSSTDRLGRTTTYTYDALGRHTSTTAADNTTTSSGYDNDGNLTSQTNQNAHATSYTYDSRNRLTSTTDALSRTTTFAYDAAGQLISKTDPSGRTTTLSYNTAGDKTGASYSDGATPNETFTYTVLHQPATITDGTGTTTMGYDSLGRLTSRTNGAGKNITYAYDLAGNITAQTYPNGQTVTRTYDAANNLTSLTDWLNNTTTFTTTADSQPASTAYANGVTAATTYDSAGLPLNITASTTTGSLASFGYTRNDNGNLASATTTGISQPVESYGYTNREQLASINTSSYSYDPTGNPTALATGATLTYDAANQPTQYILAGTTTPITHDSQGNRLTGPAPSTGTTTYTWNQANRLTAANGTTFTYAADGLRASRRPATGPTQTYTWDTTRAVPLMLTDGSLSYIYDAAGNPVEHIDATGTVHYYQQDQYGSTRLLTDSTGTVAATFTFDPYGNLTQKTGTADTPLRWNGQNQDTDTGLYYLRARYYDPKTAQFISTDPFVAMTRAIYTYADNNPLNRHDPLGLWSWNPAEWNDNEKATAGYVLGGIGLVAGLAALVVAGPALITALTFVSVGASLVSAGLSAGPCSRGQKLACGGMILSSVSLAFSGVGRIKAFAGKEALGYEIMGTMLGGGGFALDTLDYMGTGEVSTKCK